MAKFTELDRQILERLNRNGRLTSAELARELGVVERSVRYRLNRLIAEGVARPVLVLNPAAFGYDLVVDVVCEVDMSQQQQVIEAIKNMPEVSYMAYSTGEQDISFQALFRNSEEMHHFITGRLHTIPGIRRTRTALVPRIIKDTYQWLPPAGAFGGE